MVMGKKSLVLYKVNGQPSNLIMCTLPALVQGYKLMHITFKAHKIDPSKILHSTVHEVNKEPPHSAAEHTAKPEVLP